MASSDGPPSYIDWVEGHLHLPNNGRLAPAGVVTQQPVPRTAVFLDRDGVLVEDVHFLKSPSQLNILPGVSEALRTLQDDFLLIVVTNQSGIARSFFTEEDLFSIHEEMVGRLAAEGVALDALYYCPHLPDPTMGAYGVECECRKPKPGILLNAGTRWDVDLNSSFMIGDKPRDVEAGRRAGTRCILLGDHPEAPPRGGTSIIPNLAAAARFIIDNHRIPSKISTTESVSNQGAV